MRMRMLRRAQPKRQRARCARDTPMKASGAARSRHAFREGIPIPGSTRTGTAPRRKRAKERAKKRRLGGTISTVRVPRSIPTEVRAWQSRSTSSSSWRKLHRA